MQLSADEPSLVERIFRHLAEIAVGRCSITDEAIDAEPDPTAQEILAGLLLVHEDLEQRKNQTEELNERLQKAVRARDDFLSIASHELRTPITTLGLQMEGLRRLLAVATADEVREALPRRIDVIGRQVQRLTSLVSELIDVSRIQTGRVPHAPEHADLLELARSVAERFEVDAQRSGSALKVVSTLPLWGSFEVFRLDQVLSNLISNAIRYGRGQPIEIGVDQLDGHARIWVRDEGIGIAAEHQGRIFLQFERAAASTNRAGLGLGLWICRQLVEDMGGSISVQSQPGVGSTFTVELPCAPSCDQPRPGKISSA